MGKLKDLTGQKFNRLTVIERAETPLTGTHNGVAVAIVATLPLLPATIYNAALSNPVVAFAKNCSTKQHTEWQIRQFLIVGEE